MCPRIREEDLASGDRTSCHSLVVSAETRLARMKFNRGKGRSFDRWCLRRAVANGKWLLAAASVLATLMLMA
jgi:hypothetical protein